MKLAVLCDLLEERWPSMDLVSEMLVEHAGRMPNVSVERIQPALPPRLRALATNDSGGSRLGRLTSLSLGRYVVYPLSLGRVRRRFDWYHVADHSYAHLALGLPAARTGVFCHDIDALRALFVRDASGWRRHLARTLLLGLRRARVVFYSTPSVRAEIVERGLLDPTRLVAAPYGSAPEFQPERRPEDFQLVGRPRFLLHVGSLIPRKNPEGLLRVFGAVRSVVPELVLVQVGGVWNDACRAFIRASNLGDCIHQLRDISRAELAAYYRAAAAVLLPSKSEGFGLPVIEALACGAPVVVSDIAVLRQVGGEGVVRCPVDDLPAWRDAVLSVLSGRAPALSARLAAAAKYSWTAHAKTIVGAYERLAARDA